MTSSAAGSTQARKLGIKPGMRVAIDHAPVGWSLTEAPPYLDALGQSVDLLIFFARAAEQIAANIEALGARIFPDGALWLAWPRRASGHTSDVTDNKIRDIVLPLGLVDVKVAAIDHDWSGLKIVWRREQRP